MKLLIFMCVLALACHSLQAWENCECNAKHCSGSIQTSYSGSVHSMNGHGHEHCVGSFSGTNEFHHSSGPWSAFATRCKELLGGIISMLSHSFGCDGHTAVDLDLKSHVVNRCSGHTTCSKTPNCQCAQCKQNRSPSCAESVPVHAYHYHHHPAHCTCDECVKVRHHHHPPHSTCNECAAPHVHHHPHHHHHHPHPPHCTCSECTAVHHHHPHPHPHPHPPHCTCSECTAIHHHHPHPPTCPCSESTPPHHHHHHHPHPPTCACSECTAARIHEEVIPTEEVILPVPVKEIPVIVKPVPQPVYVTEEECEEPHHHKHHHHHHHHKHHGHHHHHHHDD